MAKRRPGTQLTHDNWDDDEEPEEAGNFVSASADILSQRQIKKAKRRGPTAPAEGGGAFKGFAGFKGSEATKIAASSFSFGSSTGKPLSGVSNGAGCVTTTAGAFKITPFTFGAQTTDNGGKSATVSVDSADKSASSDKSKNKDKYLQQLKNLNESVTKWIKEHVEKNPFCILSPIFKDYETHLGEIEKKFPEESKQAQEETSKETIDKNADTTATTDSGVSSTSGFNFKSMVKEESSKQTLQADTTKSRSGFTFGSKGTSLAAASSTFGGFNFKPSSTGDSGFKPFSFGSEKSGTGTPFSFATGKPESSESASAEGGTAGGNEEEYVPPKPEVKEIKEDGAFYTKRCKLFYQKDGSWIEKGVGNLHLKKLADEKSQLLIRADTNLGNILLNIMLSSAIPLKRQGKNNVSMICIPNPPFDPKDEGDKPKNCLLRVKTGEDADELFQKITEAKG